MADLKADIILSAIDRATAPSTFRTIGTTLSEVPPAPRMAVMAEVDTSTLVAFISYSHKDREVAREAKQVLAKAGIDAFFAHDDLEVSEQWQSRIKDELRCCNLFVPLLSKNFRESPWTLQEIGFIASRSEVKIAPLSMAIHQALVLLPEQLDEELGIVSGHFATVQLAPAPDIPQHFQHDIRLGNPIMAPVSQQHAQPPLVRG